MAEKRLTGLEGTSTPLDVSRCTMSPSGTAFASFCDHQYIPGPTYVNVLCQGATLCSEAMPGDCSHVQAEWQTAQGWSPSGRYFALISPQDHGGGLQAQVFDTTQHRWLPAVPVEAGAHPAEIDLELQLISFCDSDERLAAAIYCVGCEDGVLLLGVHQPCPMRQVPSANEYENWILALRWLPGTTSLLVVGSSCWARLDLSLSSLSGDLELQWVSVTDTRGLDLIPGTGTALVLHSDCRGQGNSSMCLSAYDTAFVPSEHVPFYSDTEYDPRGLAPLATCTYRQSPAPGDQASLHCSWRAAAVSFGGTYGVKVFLLDDGRPRRRLFWAKHLTACAWSACGAFLAGIVEPCDVAVLDGRTGDSLMQISGRRLFNGCAIEDLGVFSIAWTDVGHLHATSYGLSTRSDPEQAPLVLVQHTICSFAA